MGVLTEEGGELLGDYAAHAGVDDQLFVQLGTDAVEIAVDYCDEWFEARAQA